MNLIANISLIAAALFDMVVMLGGDIMAHSINGHSNSKYYSWLNKSGELTSPKRLLLLAVFIAIFTTMAQQSWMVVLILAASLLVQGIVLLKRRQWKLMDLDKRSRLMLALAIILAIISIALFFYNGSKTSMEFASRAGAMLAAMILLITPLLTMLVAWLLSHFIKKREYDNPHNDK